MRTTVTRWSESEYLCQRNMFIRFRRSDSRLLEGTITVTVAGEEIVDMFYHTWTKIDKNDKKL